MNIFKAIAKPFVSVFDFFRHLFGNAGPVVQKVITETSDIVKKAQPIVDELAKISRALPQSQFIVEVEKVISIYQTDAAKVSAFLADLGVHATLADVLRKAAVFALQALEPAVASSALNYAVELAVQILKAA
jgi:hypothetical protein